MMVGRSGPNERVYLLRRWSCMAEASFCTSFAMERKATTLLVKKGLVMDAVQVCTSKKERSVHAQVMSFAEVSRGESGALIGLYHQGWGWGRAER